MSDFTVRSDSVDVEQIMKQIRARIREKRGADYTEAELKQLATVQLEKFLDPRGVRSDLVEQFKKSHKPAEWPNYAFEEDTIYASHRGFIRMARRLLRPVLKLMFNPDTITSALNVQSKLNTELLRQQERESLRYELVHNLVVETTRLGIEVQNLKMKVESVSSRLDFDERRSRSLEKVVEYRPDAVATRPATVTAAIVSPTIAPAGRPPSAAPGVEGGERKRRRRRRRRKPGATLADSSAPAESNEAGSSGESTGTTGAMAQAELPEPSAHAEAPAPSSPTEAPAPSDRAEAPTPSDQAEAPAGPPSDAGDGGRDQ